MPVIDPNAAVNPDGSPNYGVLSTTANASVLGQHTDASGRLDIWNLPTDVKGATLWYDTSHSNRMVAVGPTGQGRIREQDSKQVNATTEDIMAQVQAMSFNDPGKYQQIQAALASGPFGTVHLNGAFDQDTEKALSTAMQQYLKLTHGAGVGVSFQDYLLQTASTASQLSAQQSSASAAAAAAAQTVSVTDPASIRDAAQQAAQQALGQNLSDAQLSQFVSQFQSAQTSAERQVGGTATAPDLTSQAMQFAQGADPKQFKDQNRQTYMNALINMFNPPTGSGRPDMGQPTPAI